MTTFNELLDDLDEAIQRAAVVMDLGDVDWEGMDEIDEMNIYESRHHCGTCQVRTVLEVLWPSIEAWLKERE